MNLLEQFADPFDVPTNPSLFHGTYDADGTSLIVVVRAVHTGEADRKDKFIAVACFSYSQQGSER